MSENSKVSDKNLYILSALGLLFCVVSRAPLLLDKVSILSLSLNVNVGYIVVFAPIFLGVGLLFIIFKNKQLERNIRATHQVLYSCICFFMVFLILQFTLNFSLKGECGNISPIQFLWDFSLYEVKPVYCFSGIAESVQNQMPYIYAPVQVWCYLLLAAFCVSRVYQSVFRSGKLSVDEENNRKNDAE